MLKQELYERYGLIVQRFYWVSSYRGFITTKGRYVMLPADGQREEDINAFSSLLTCLRNEAISGLLVPIQSRHGQYVETFFGESMVVCYDRSTARQQRPLLEELGYFHSRTQQCSPLFMSSASYVPWNERWSQRVDELETLMRRGRDPSIERSSFRRRLGETFPYFLGLAENAIQYVVDTQLEEGATNTRTLAITHRRFSDHTWLPYDGVRLKIPTTWLIDHPMRDLAEWCRPYLQYPNGICDISKGLQAYTRQQFVTKKDWRFLYGRLLFPLSMFDDIERYLQGTNPHERVLDEQALTKTIENVPQYEQNMRALYLLLTRHTSLPAIQWLVS